MGLKGSKRVRRIVLAVKSVRATFYLKALPLNSGLLLSVYPRLVLNKREFKQFKIMREVFKTNYKDIIATDPFFFVKTLRQHFAWVNSQEFKTKYGNVLSAKDDCKDNGRAAQMSTNIASNMTFETSGVKYSTQSADSAMFAPPPPQR